MEKNEIYLRFGISDFDDITHDEITKLMGVSPSRIYIKGQKRNPNVNILAKQNVWLIDSIHDKYTSFEDQMNSLLDLLEPKINVLKVFTEKYYCEFSCAVYIYKGNGESTPWLHLNTRYNKLIKELNIEFDLDLYCLQMNQINHC